MKKEFIRFLELLISEKYTRKDWENFIQNHYQDKDIETTRHSISKYFIENKIELPFSEEAKQFLRKKNEFLTHKESKSYIKITRIPYEEPHHLNLIIEAANEKFSGKMEIYCNSADLNKCAKALQSFSGSKEDHFKWELGSEDKNDRFAFYFLLQISSINAYGKYVIHFKMNKNEKAPEGGLIEFYLKADLESIHELREKFHIFSKLETLAMEWTPNIN